MSGLDENRYSRQLYVLGREPMARFMETTVLVSGLGGLGVEIAKNLILSGIKSLTLHDSKDCSWADLSSQFFLSENSIGENRAKSCLPYLRQLNTLNVRVELFEGELALANISNFKIIVCTEGVGEDVSHLADLCHNHGIYFIMGETRGVFSRIFCDFGEKYTITDPEGRELQKIPIKHISRTASSVLTCEAEYGHELQTGDSVLFGDIKGMIELNDQKVENVIVLNSHQFTIGDTRAFSNYISGGFVKKEIQPKVLQFETLSDSLKKPEYIIPDGAKQENPLQIHLAFRAFNAFVKKNNRMPIPWSNDDERSLIEEAAFINKYDTPGSLVKSIDLPLLEIFSFTCAANLSPTNSFIGGIVAQEVIKAATGKFCPLFQWMFFDSMECIDVDCFSESENNFLLLNSRYDGQISAFGRVFQDKLKNLKVFVVGAGAIGCELLKNMALMGIGTGPRGKIIVTDMDLIEKSNLCRQLLYRDSDIGKSKAFTAANAVKRINPDVNIEAHENEVGPATENIYDKKFYSELDIVAIALDNIPARRYMDKMCVEYRKPLLESGTSGTKGNSQVIVPEYSQCYRDKGVPKQKVIPMCTLKHFPYLIAHTIQWARELFEESFAQEPKNAYDYINGRRIWEDDCDISDLIKISIASSLKKILIDDRPTEFLHCLKWAVIMFDKLYVNDIKQLLHNFPKDHKDKQGSLFWSGLKRCPKALEFNYNTQEHFDFVYSAANLRAEVFGVAKMPHPDAVYAYLQKINDEEAVPHFIPKDDVYIDDGDLEEAEKNESVGQNGNLELLEKLVASIPPPNEFKDISIKPLHFEKDDATNFHIDFITAASNLRALCYSIDPVDTFITKQIAGNIIPAISTSTSVAAGLVCLELYKLLLDREVVTQFGHFKDCYFNLAVPIINFAKTSKAKKITCSNGFTWDLWSRFEVYEKDCKTLGEFVEHFRANYTLDISVLSCGAHVLYFNWMPEENKKDVLDMSLVEIIKTKTKGIISKTSSVKLEIRCGNLEMDEWPPVIYFLQVD